MKKLVIIMISVMVISTLKAQNPTVDKLFKKYADKEGFTSVHITKYMFDLFADIETEEEDEFIEITKSLEGIRILHSDKETGVNLYESAIKDFPSPQYAELMTIHEKGQDIKFLIKKKGKVISEFIMLAGGNDGNTLISINGEIDLKKIVKLSKSLKIDGFEKIEKMEEKE